LLIRKSPFDWASLRHEGSPSGGPRPERRGSSTPFSVVKTLLCAFGPLLLLTALGLIGSRMASLDARTTVTSSVAGPHPTFARSRE
jgi:hypothetical protein